MFLRLEPQKLRIANDDKTMPLIAIFWNKLWKSYRK